MDREEVYEIYINDDFYGVKHSIYQGILDEINPKYVGQPNTEETMAKIKCDIHNKLLQLINIGELLPIRPRKIGFSIEGKVKEE